MSIRQSFFEILKKKLKKFQKKLKKGVDKSKKVLYNSSCAAEENRRTEGTKFKSLSSEKRVGP